MSAAFRKALRVQFVSGTQAEPGLRSFRAAVELIVSGAIDVEHCVTPSRPLAMLPEAVAAGREQREVKINIAVGGSLDAGGEYPPGHAREVVPDVATQALSGDQPA